MTSLETERQRFAAAPESITTWGTSDRLSEAPTNGGLPYGALIDILPTCSSALRDHLPCTTTDWQATLTAGRPGVSTPAADGFPLPIPHAGTKLLSTHVFGDFRTCLRAVHDGARSRYPYLRRLQLLEPLHDPVQRERSAAIALEHGPRGCLRRQPRSSPAHGSRRKSDPAQPLLVPAAILPACASAARCRSGMPPLPLTTTLIRTTEATSTSAHSRIRVTTLCKLSYKNGPAMDWNSQPPTRAAR